MRVSFVAGFGPVVRDMAASTSFYGVAAGVPLQGDAEYRHTDALAGVRHFALWPLSGAAQSCFGRDTWPEDLAVPQAWLEFDVESAEAVSAAAAELQAAGYPLLRRPSLEPWGQTVARLLSPEGLLVGIAFTPSMHEEGSQP